jgi:hypothetical protein
MTIGHSPRDKLEHCQRRKDHNSYHHHAKKTLLVIYRLKTQILGI